MVCFVLFVFGGFCISPEIAQSEQSSPVLTTLNNDKRYSSTNCIHPSAHGSMYHLSALPEAPQSAAYPASSLLQIWICFTMYTL